MGDYFVYTLKLENGKYYVGRTGNLKRRLRQHFKGKGALWTRKHSPIKVLNTVKCKSEIDSKLMETKIYYKRKEQFGKDNVRGAGNTSSQ